MNRHDGLYLGKLVGSLPNQGTTLFCLTMLINYISVCRYNIPKRFVKCPKSGKLQKCLEIIHIQRNEVPTYVSFIVFNACLGVQYTHSKSQSVTVGVYQHTVKTIPATCRRSCWKYSAITDPQAATKGKPNDCALTKGQQLLHARVQLRQIF